jgi:hypothetical protein
VTGFLVETYTSAAADMAEIRARVRSAATSASLEGSQVRYLRSIFVPADETSFHQFEAGSADDVRRAVERVGLTPERIVEAHTWCAPDAAAQQTQEIR